MAVPDHRSFERTMLPHLRAAYNLARWLVRDASLVDDVVQDAYLRALSYFGSFKGGDARGWLLRIVRNAAYARLATQRQSRCGTANLEEAGLMPDGGPVRAEVADPADDPEAALFRAEAYTQLDQAIAALPAELRECLVLHELEELSYKEIAHITGVPIGTVMSRLWRARQTLMRKAPMRDESRGGAA